MRLLILLLLLSCNPKVIHEINVELDKDEVTGDTLCFDTYEGLLPSQGKALFKLGEPFGDVPQVSLPETRVEVRKPVVGKIVGQKMIFETADFSKATVEICEIHDTIFSVDTVYVSKSEGIKIEVFVPLLLIWATTFYLLGYLIRSRNNRGVRR